MRSFKTMVAWAATSLLRTGGSGGTLPVQQVAHLGKASNSIPWFAYGYDANVPANRLSVLLSVFGNDSKAHLPGSPGEAPEVATTEVQVYHPPTGSRVHFLQDGSIRIEAGETTAELSADGGITLTPGSSPVTVAGDLTVTGSTALGSTVTSNGKDISDTHTHTAGSYLDSVAGAVTGTSGVPT